MLTLIFSRTEGSGSVIRRVYSSPWCETKDVHGGMSFMFPIGNDFQTIAVGGGFGRVELGEAAGTNEIYDEGIIMNGSHIVFKLECEALMHDVVIDD